ncbi:type II toxin-antitoxin system RelB/DinJ family antitoxin [Planctomycetota bacterium]
MSKKAIIQARIDPKTKARAKIILEALDLNLTDAICLFLKQVVLHKGIPFEIKIPNELTAETLKKIDRDEDVHEVASVSELFKELNS